MSDQGPDGHMSSDLYLICHKVRGEPAFDVAIQIPCPECDNDPGCSECDGLGYWWIIPTSGHRAYAWRWWPLASLEATSTAEIQDWDDVVQPLDEIQNGIPDSLPDHYTTRAEPKVDLITQLGLAKPTATLPPIKRRF